VVRAWLTTSDKTHLMAPQPALVFAAAVPDALRIDVEPSRRYQVMAGFGASITDAAAWLMQNRMSEPQRASLLKELFSREGNGIGLDFTRLTIGASDFSRTHYSLDDLPQGQTDMDLARFSLDANRSDALPIVKRALALNPQPGVERAGPRQQVRAPGCTTHRVHGRGDMLETVAFQSVDDGSVVLIVCNSGPKERQVSIVQGGLNVLTVMPRESVATFVWKPAA
jgi:O-glycosyl hydrolase